MADKDNGPLDSATTARESIYQNLASSSDAIKPVGDGEKPSSDSGSGTSSSEDSHSDVSTSTSNDESGQPKKGDESADTEAEGIPDGSGPGSDDTASGGDDDEFQG